MLHSTPHRRSGSKQTSSDRFTCTPPISQDGLKKSVPHELQDATWQLDATCLARALSAKSRKKDASLLTTNFTESPDRNNMSLDSLHHYDVAIDRLDNVLETAVQLFTPNKLNSVLVETESYVPLKDFLNACLAACRKAAKLHDKHYYSELNFIVWDRPTKDGVRGAHAVKPDIAGAHSLSEGTTELWWRPPSGLRSSTMELPVEMKGDWRELVAQAASYARCLTGAVLLRQFSLVIGYNHKTHGLRFLVFHAGGLTSSPPLDPNNPSGCRDILRLFLSLLSWQSAGDAGLPEWCNDLDAFVQRDQHDMKGVQMRVKEVYYDRLGLRGRGSKVIRLSPICQPSPSLTPPPPPHLQIPRRSLRIAEQAKENTFPTKLSNTASKKTSASEYLLVSTTGG
jgi:hypothetical protein